MTECSSVCKDHTSYPNECMRREINHDCGGGDWFKLNEIEMRKKMNPKTQISSSSIDRLKTWQRNTLDLQEYIYNMSRKDAMQKSDSHNGRHWLKRSVFYMIFAELRILDFDSLVWEVLTSLFHQG